MGIDPALGVEVFAIEESALEKALREAVRLEFARHRRLRDVHQIVSAIWYDTTELLRHDVDLQFHTPRELEQIQERKRESLLPKIAQPLHIQKRVVYEYKEQLDQLVRAVKNKLPAMYCSSDPRASEKRPWSGSWPISTKNAVSI